MTNAAPEFTEGATATREIQETLGSDTTATAADIGAAVAATDTDTTDTLTYTLEGTDASSFGIVSTYRPAASSGPRSAWPTTTRRIRATR